MKHVLILFVVMCLVIVLGVVAQSTSNSSPEVSETQRVYPIAAGVWYPGEPLPEKPFRYYRMRCWPGCHHNSQYGKYPDLPEKAALAPESTKVPREYPIAPGIWYPGEPLPEKSFRYYRIRCWPGCHHNSQYGKYPDKPATDKSTAVPIGGNK